MSALLSPCYITPPCLPPNYRVISAMVRRFIAGVCGSNGGSKPPPYTIDRLILWSYDRPPRGFAVLSLGTAPRPPKTLRCSARCRGQFVARTWFLRVENFEHALFYANCPLLACFGRWLCPLIVFRFVRPTNFVCRFAFCFPD